MAQEAEDAAKCGQMKDVYDATRRLCSEPPKKIDVVRSNEGSLLTKEEEVKQRWKEYFVELLNTLNPEREAEVISDMDCQIHQKVTNVSTNSKTAGLKINSEKTKLLRLNTTGNENVQTDEHDIEDVELKFCVLGCTHQQARKHRRRHQSKVRESKDCI